MSENFNLRLKSVTQARNGVQPEDLPSETESPKDKLLS